MPVKKTQSKKSIVSSKWFKIGLPVAAVIVFAGIGTYMVRSSSAANGELYQISSIAGHNCSTTSKYPATIRQGSRGECVKAFQLGINKWSAFRSWTSGGRIPYNPLATDGVFGAQTAATVRTFQSAKGLPVDGVVGQNTWDAFLRDCSVIDAQLCTPSRGK